MAEEQLLTKDTDNGSECENKKYSKGLYQNLRCGYCQMSQINLALAEMGLVEDMLELKAYEAKLGCEEL